MARTLRQLEEGVKPRWTVAPLPIDAAMPRRARMTIADLGSFDPPEYGAKLEAWCRATLESVRDATDAA